MTEAGKLAIYDTFLCTFHHTIQYLINMICSIIYIYHFKILDPFTLAYQRKRVKQK